MCCRARERLFGSVSCPAVRGLHVYFQTARRPRGGAASRSAADGVHFCERAAKLVAVSRLFWCWSSKYYHSQVGRACSGVGRLFRNAIRWRHARTVRFRSWRHNPAAFGASSCIEWRTADRCCDRGLSFCGCANYKTVLAGVNGILERPLSRQGESQVCQWGARRDWG